MIKEIRRQSIHFFFGSIFIALVALIGVTNTTIILIACLALGLIASLLIKKQISIPILHPIATHVEREHEKHLPGKGAILFFAGAIILMLLFQNQLIVLGALMVAIYGDSASTIFGVKFGKHRTIGKKTIEGTIAGIAVSFFFLQFLFPIEVALIAATIGMLAELLPVDDNFTIPIATAIVLTIL